MIRDIFTVLNVLYMHNEKFHLSKMVTSSFENTVERVTVELQKEGFGIITTIDLKEAFKKKLNVDFRNYLILGACNPRLAHEALLAEDKIGVYLPCNVVIQQQENSQVEVSIINPEELIGGTNDLSLKTFASKVKEAMQNVLDRL